VARTLRLLVDRWGWPVVPGAFAEDGRCSCGDRHCPEPGWHALADASWLAATSDPERVRDRWRTHPEAAIVLPVGWCFDLLDVPERGGREALGRLEMMGHEPPPVIATVAGRLLFLVSALDRRPSDVAEAGSGAPAPRSAASPRSAGSGAAGAAGGVGRGRAGRREASARDAAAARAAVAELEPWPTSSTWLASAAGCRPETSIWVGGGAPDAPDVVVRRSGLLVVPLLGPEPPGVTRWLVPPAPVRRPLARMEDLLGPIVHACRDAAPRPPYGLGGRREPLGGRRESLGGRPEPLMQRPDRLSRRPEAVRGGGVAPLRGLQPAPRQAEPVPGGGVVAARASEPAPRRAEVPPGGGVAAARASEPAPRAAEAVAGGGVVAARASEPVQQPSGLLPVTKTRVAPARAAASGLRRPEPVPGPAPDAGPGPGPRPDPRATGPRPSRPLERLARPVLGLVAGRRPGSGPGRGTQPPLAQGVPGPPGGPVRRGAPRVD